LALFVKSAAASTAFRPAFVTIAKRPFEEQNARVVKVICPMSEAKYFFEWDWTGSISLIRFDKLAFWRKQLLARIERREAWIGRSSSQSTSSSCPAGDSRESALTYIHIM
jgi:hypothetical protein